MSIGKGNMEIIRVALLVAMALVLAIGGTASANILGDVDGDGHVNAIDWSLLCAAYLSYPAEIRVNEAANARWDARADFNGDGQITAIDASILITHYGE